MMGYQLFQDVIQERILEVLPPMYGECKVTIHKMRKVNEEKDCLSVMPEGGEGMIAACPNIYLDDLYEEFKECQDMDHILRKAVACILQYTGRLPAEIMDLKERKEYIVMNLINTERNRGLLDTIPHKEVMDLSIIYRIVMTQGEEGLHTILINDAVMEELNMTEEELEALACQNTMRMFPAELSKLTDHLYMMTNSVKIHGATTMVYRDAIKSLSEQMGKNLYIIPSSIHEVMIVPEESAELKFLIQTLSESNRLYVADQEILSNSIYYYNRKRGRISMAASHFLKEDI